MDAFGELQSLTLAYTRVSGVLAADWASTFNSLSTLNLSATGITGPLPTGRLRTSTDGWLSG